MTNEDKLAGLREAIREAKEFTARRDAERAEAEIREYREAFEALFRAVDLVLDEGGRDDDRPT